MNIIIVPDRLAKAKTVCLNGCGLATALGGMLAGLVLLAMFFAYGFVYFLGPTRLPGGRELLLSAQRAEAERHRRYLEESLAAMARKLGEMQAQVARLDALGERVASLAGIPRETFRFDQKPARGGAEASAARTFEFSEFAAEIGQTERAIEDRGDRLAVMEAWLSREKLRRQALPSAPPVALGFFSSNFGWRIDPFSGFKARHEGVDFMAPEGTPIQAAAGGIVVYAGDHPSYGKMIDIDHGNGLISRYAHASRLLVETGDVVLRGQKIGEVGSTGRSTGPHLHFEVRDRGVPQNPTRYLRAAGK